MGPFQPKVTLMTPMTPGVSIAAAIALSSPSFGPARLQRRFGLRLPNERMKARTSHPAWIGRLRPTQAMEGCLQPNADCQARAYVGQPVREQHQACRRNPKGDGPDRQAPRCRNPPGERRRDGAQVRRISRGEGVPRLAGARHAVARLAHDATVWPLLVDELLQQVRQGGGRSGDERQVIGPPAGARVLGQQPDTQPSQTNHA